DPQKIQQIHAAGQSNPAIFAIVGDELLGGIVDVGGPNLALDQFQAELAPIVQFYDAAIKGAAQPWNNGNFGVADILNQAKGTAICQGKAPLTCALDANPAIVFISVGRHDLAANVPLPQFKANLEAAVNAVLARGAIPILVTMTGPGPDPKVSQYNNEIYDVAAAAQIPLFNVFGIKAQIPALIQNGL